MIRSSAALVALVAVLGCGTPTWNQPASENKARKHVQIQFTNGTLHPTTARVLAGGNVVWINYAEGYDGTVVFSDSFKNALTCADARPLFSKVAAGYQSLPIKGDSENITLPCALKPGSYPYELWLFSEGTLYGAGGMPTGIDNPQSQIQGTIVFE